mgnify:CR=1 FL=1
MFTFASLAATRKTAGALAAAAAALVLAAPGCSSETKVVPATCDDAKCAPGNKCLPLDGEVKCRKVCTSNTDPTASCPFGYTCVPQDGVEAFCVKDRAELTQGPGQWGNPCNAAGGLDANPDCDSAQGFYCYGTSPNDGASYCTRYDCETDRDCGAGFYCGDANIAPNVTTTKRTVGQTQRVCLKRSYCAPCKADLDCPAQNGIPQRCVPDDDGNGFCSPECTNSQNCNFEAQCVSGLTDLTVWYPRAGGCVGDGSLCSPCRSDADCPQGACVQGTYTTEKSCTVKSGITCKDGSQNGTDFDCPTVASPKVPIRCLGMVFDTVPRDHCHGLYPLGQSADVGCWTPRR